MSVATMLDSLIQKIGNIPNIILRLGNNFSTRSLTEVTQAARVEPLTIISRDLIHQEYTADILQTLLNMFSGYYLQAIALSSRIDDVKIVRILDRLNPDRHFNDLMVITEDNSSNKNTLFLKDHKSLVGLSLESFEYRLPTSTNVAALEDECERMELQPALEAKKKSKAIDGVKKGGFHKWLNKAEDEPITDADIKKGLASSDKHVQLMAQFAKSAKKFNHKKGVAAEAIGTDELNKINVISNDDYEKGGLDGVSSLYEKSALTNIDLIKEADNLAVGKLLNVTITVDKTTVNIPVSVRLATATLPNQSILHILALKKEDNTLVERFHSWRAGRISFIKDLILCQDLINEHKRALMNDESGVYTEIIKRVNNSKKFGVLSNNPSLVSASNIFVMSEEVARELEHLMGGKLDNARIRTRVFENTYAMIIAVVNREFERVTFYHRDITQSTEVSLKEIKNVNKNNKGPDITDILKALSSGNAPIF